MCLRLKNNSHLILVAYSLKHRMMFYYNNNYEKNESE